MEALAVVKAIQFVRELEISKAVLEGNSKMIIINALKDDKSSLTTQLDSTGCKFYFHFFYSITLLSHQEGR